MNRSFKALLILLSALILPISVYCQQRLDIYEYIRLARKNDVEIKRILHERVQTTFLKSLSLPSPAILLSVANEYGFALGDGKRTTTWTLGAEKPFQTTGTTVSALHQINKQEDREVKETTVSVEQALLKNALGKQNRRLATKLSKENEVILLQTLETYEDYIASIIYNYLDWQLTYLNRKVAKSLLDESQTLEGYIKQRRKRNIAADVDVEKITLESMGYKEAVLELDVSLTKQMAAISSTTGAAKPEELFPSDELDWIKAPEDLNHEKERSLEKGRMLRAYQLTEEAGKLNISIRKEDLHPELNLVFGFGYDDSTRYNIRTDRKEIFVGFNLELPLFDTTTKASVKQAKYEKMSASLARSQYTTNLKSSLNAQLNRIQKQRKRVDLSGKRWRLSENVAKKERVRYQNGKIGLETLIIARQAMAKNRFDHLSNQIQLNKDLIEWLRLTDRLVIGNDEVKL